MTLVNKTVRIFLLVILVCTIFLTACNYSMLDTVWEYDYALVGFPDGTVEKIEIEQWLDYDGEQLQIVGEDGDAYLVSSFNTVLVKEGN